MNRLYQRILLLLSVVMTGVSGMWAASPDKITLNTSSASGMTATYVKMTNTYVISTRSTSPYILSSALTSDLGGDNMVLAFQYKSTSGLSERPRFYLGTTYTLETSVLGPSIESTTEWTDYAVDLTDLRTKLLWGSTGDIMRIDFGAHSLRSLQIRNMVIRPRTIAEKDAAGVKDPPRRMLRFYKDGEVIKKLSMARVDSVALDGGTTFRVYNAAHKLQYRVAKSAVDSLGFSDYDSDPELITEKNVHQMTAAYDDATQVYSFNISGSDPFIYSKKLTSTLPADSCVLTFEYRSSTGIGGDLQIFFAPDVKETRSVKMGGLDKSSVWKTFSYNIKQERSDYSWGKAGDYMRFDLGSTAGQDLQIRGFRIRGMNAEELAVQRAKDSVINAKKAMAARIKSYLTTNVYPCSVDSVGVSQYSVTVTGTIGGAINESNAYYLVDVPPFSDITETKKFSYLRYKISSNKFSARLPRKVTYDGTSYDRVLSRWALVKVFDNDSDILVSRARYADTVRAISKPAFMPLKSKKGVGAGDDSSYFYQDLDSLDLGSITVNLDLSWIMQEADNGNCDTYNYLGRTYYIDRNARAYYDRHMEAAYKRGIIVSAIVLIPSASYLRDPENEGGYYSMPNMTTSLAVNKYAAALNYMAQRYCGSEHGRINHWIMHNEVDMANSWTNMGWQPIEKYVDRYVKSMRLCYNIVRQYDQNAFVLGSYSHSWTEGSEGNMYTTKEMIELEQEYSNAEGDFKWGIAYHPYPYNLLKPAFWKDDVKRATFDMNTPYVTFRNPEVISAWITDKAHLYKGRQKRILFFSEQGTNSPSYSDTDLALQAAGACWMWKKIQKLDGVDAMQWHNWKDNPAEFGLRIGLRAFDDASAGVSNYDIKPSYRVWQAAGTDREDEVFKPYLDVIGISSWDNLIQPVTK